MKENKDCKVIQDLLPNYIEKLTSEETNQFIEEHLKSCKDCQEMLDSMKAEIKVDKVQQDDREVEYIKKFNIKFKKVEYRLFTLIYTIIALLIISIVVYFGRKYIIVQDLLNKLDEYSQKTNYYIKTNGYQDSNVPMEVWVREGVGLVTYNSGDDLLDNSIYVYNGNSVYEYRDGEMNFQYGINDISENLSLEEFWSQIKFERQILGDIKTIFNYSITEEILNGKKCYRLKENDQMGYIIYFEKETGLLARFEDHGRYDEPRTIHTDKIQNNSFTDYEYKFDIVTTEDVNVDLRKKDIAKEGKYEETVEIVHDNLKVSVSNIKFDSEKRVFYADIKFYTLDNHTISDGVFFDYEIFNDDNYIGSSLEGSYQNTFEDVPIASVVNDKEVKYHIEISNFSNEYNPYMDKIKIRISNVKFPNSEYDEIYQDNKIVSFDKDFIFILKK